VSELTFPRRPEADALSFRLQRGFRALLDAMARPGELAELGALAPDAEVEGARMGLLPQTLTLADVLLDGQTSVCVAGPAGEAQARELSRRTHVRIRPAAEASFCILPQAAAGPVARETIAALSAGTLISPHLGATVLVECATLVGRGKDGRLAGSASGNTAAWAFELEGPGIAGASRITCDRADAIEAAVAREDEFPCGIDLVLIDGAGHVACIPRSSKVTPAGEAHDFEGVGSWAM
jgi:alpha-D-ribose 1-methylphosphonate 5-triphosphate synthase subunit PhnH